MSFKTILPLLIAPFFFTISCAKDEDDNAAQAASEQQAATSDNLAIDVENSINLLDLHIDDIRQLQDSADSVGLSEIAANANSLAVIYDFTLKAKLTKSAYSEAAYEWEKAELDYKRLLAAYNAAASAELAQAWQAYSKSRLRMVQLKAKWNEAD